MAAAAGPACASAESSASPALTAMGVTTDQARGALRLSFGALSEDGHGVLAAGAVVRCARAAAARKRGRLMLRQDDFELAGRVPEPDGEGFAGGSACGDRVRITLALGADGTIAAARFGAAACAHATAAAAWACRRSQGHAIPGRRPRVARRLRRGARARRPRP